MAYLLLLINSFVSTAGIMVYKHFQRGFPGDLPHKFLYLSLNGLFAALYFAAACGFSVPFHLPTVIYAAVYAAIIAATLLFNLVIYRYLQMTTVSVIEDGAGFVIKTLIGAWIFSETITMGGWAAFMLRLAAIIIPFRYAFRDRAKKFGIFLCLLATAVSCAGSFLMKAYMQDSRVLEPSLCFFWLNVFLFGVCGAVFGILCIKCVRGRQNIPKFKAGQIGSIALITATSNISSLLNAYIYKVMPLYLSTILIGALGLIFVTVAARVFYKEKITKDVALSAALSILAIICSAAF